MKKHILPTFIAMVLAVACACAGCGGKDAGQAESRTPSQTSTVAETIEARMQEEAAAREEPAPAPEPETEPEEVPAPEEAPVPEEAPAADEAPAAAEGAADGVDVDLSALSSTMVYSEVYQIMTNPEDYVGKVIKMTGLFTWYEDELTRNIYYACFIQDAAACCSQGIEFVPTDDFALPEKYLEIGEEITVVGTFEIYTENGYRYITLRDAELM